MTYMFGTPIAVLCSTSEPSKTFNSISKEFRNVQSNQAFGRQSKVRALGVARRSAFAHHLYSPFCEGLRFLVPHSGYRAASSTVAETRRSEKDFSLFPRFLACEVLPSARQSTRLSTFRSD